MPASFVPQKQCIAAYLAELHAQKEHPGFISVVGHVVLEKKKTDELYFLMVGVSVTLKVSYQVCFSGSVLLHTKCKPKSTDRVLLFNIKCLEFDSMSDF